MANRREFLKNAAGTVAGFYACGALPLAMAQVPRREVSIGGRRVKIVDIHGHCAIGRRGNHPRHERRTHGFQEPFAGAASARPDQRTRHRCPGHERRGRRAAFGMECRRRDLPAVSDLDPAARTGRPAGLGHAPVPERRPLRQVDRVCRRRRRRRRRRTEPASAPRPAS